MIREELAADKETGGGKNGLSELRRADNPHQKARLGNAIIGCETSRLWVRQAARVAVAPHANSATAVAYMALARPSKRCLDAMRLVQGFAWTRGFPLWDAD